MDIVDTGANPLLQWNSGLRPSIVVARGQPAKVDPHQDRYRVVHTAPVETVGGAGSEQPSARARELIRQGAEIAMNVPSDWLDTLYEATSSAEGMRAISDDPLLSAAAQHVNRANVLQWAGANIQDPGAPVPIIVGPEQLAITRAAVRRGLSETALATYRAGQNVAWQRWMKIVFTLTSDPAELQEVLDVTAVSIARFIDGIVDALLKVIAAEVAELAEDSDVERRELVTRVLDGDTQAVSRAGERLGYHLHQRHTAAIVWHSVAHEADPAALRRILAAMARVSGASRVFSVRADATTTWVWVPGAADFDGSELHSALEESPGARVAYGSPACGVAGFRDSHREALIAQHTLARLGSARRVASFAAIELVSLVIENAERVDRFVNSTLGELATAGEDLRESVLVFVEEQCNAARAAVRLHTHRNTLLRRLGRADELLPRPLAEDPVRVAVALEVLRWRGPADGQSWPAAGIRSV
ncbi:PucR family transcriptional regulator [Nocardia carnea]|uniref:PucR family transcriptional regulator n=1 Tax=Nocardia carnea TaxID=37328 RepID=UPI002457CB7E|nr:PucR family transcriptional regulator [Nocardia carnea]